MSERHWPHDISDEELHTVFTGEHSEKGLSEPPYQYDRTEGDEHTSRLDVAALHEQSFIEYIRQRLSEKEFQNRKFRVLDMGGGAGLYADQLRTEFGDRIKVFTTGLRKKIAKNYRRNRNLKNLSKDDLKWRSILELKHQDEQGHPTEEFDLIVNTWGEFPYVFEDSSTGLLNTDNLERKLNSFFGMIISKLHQGGLASIFPVSTQHSVYVSKELEKLKSVYNFQYTFVPRPFMGSGIATRSSVRTRYCLKIKKLNSGSEGETNS